jgi:hypothetical protein
MSAGMGSVSVMTRGEGRRAGVVVITGLYDALWFIAQCGKT